MNDAENFSIFSDSMFPELAIGEPKGFILQYSEALDNVYSVIKSCIDQKSKIDDLLKGPVCHSGFKRLN